MLRWFGLSALCVGIGAPTSIARAQSSFEQFTAADGIVVDLPADWKEVQTASGEMLEDTRSPTKSRKTVQALGADGKAQAEISIALMLPQVNDVKQTDIQQWGDSEFATVRQQIQKLGAGSPDALRLLPMKVIYAGFSIIDGYYCLNLMLRSDGRSSGQVHIAETWQCPLEEGLFQVGFETAEEDLHAYRSTFARVKDSIELPDL